MWLRSSVFLREAHSRLQERGNFHISLSFPPLIVLERDRCGDEHIGEEKTRTGDGNWK